MIPPKTNRTAATRTAKSQKSGARARSSRAQSRKTVGINTSYGNARAWTRPLSIRTTSDSSHVTGGDYVSAVKVRVGGATQGSVIASYRFDMNAMSRSRLAEFAKMYELYEVNNLQFHFESVVPTTTAGCFVVYFDRDPGDSLPEGDLAMDQAYGHSRLSASFKAYENKVLTIPRHPVAQRRSLYTESVSNSETRPVREYAYGQLVIVAGSDFSSPSVDTTYFNVYVTYDITFYVPQLTVTTPDVMAFQSWLGAGVAIDTTANGGENPMVSPSNSPVAFFDNGTLRDWFGHTKGTGLDTVVGGVILTLAGRLMRFALQKITAIFTVGDGKGALVNTEKPIGSYWLDSGYYAMETTIVCQNAAGADAPLRISDKASTASGGYATCIMVALPTANGGGTLDGSYGYNTWTGNGLSKSRVEVTRVTMMSGFRVLKPGYFVPQFCGSSGVAQIAPLSGADYSFIHHRVVRQSAALDLDTPFVSQRLLVVDGETSYDSQFPKWSPAMPEEYEVWDANEGLGATSAESPDIVAVDDDSSSRGLSTEEKSRESRMRSGVAQAPKNGVRKP